MDPDLRELLAWRASFRTTQQEGADCPDEDRLIALAAGAGLPEEADRARIAEHVVGCQRCSQALRVLFDMQRQAGGTPTAEVPRRGRRSVALAAAASLLAAVAGVAVWREVDRSRGGAEPWRLRGGAEPQAVVPAAGAVLSEAPRELRWPALADARGFRLSLWDSSANLLWRSPEVAAPHIALPEDLRSRLATGNAYSWTVAVRGSLSVSKLGPFWFKVGPEPAAAR